jgi:hypothetical protein
MAIAFRAGTALATASATTFTLAGFNCQANDVIVVVIASKTNVVTSITDTIGNTYTSTQSVVSSNGTSARVELWWVISSGSNASNAITVNLSNAFKNVGAAASYSGAGSVGNTGANSGSSAAPAVTLTTQDANNWIAAGICANGTGTLSATLPNVVRETAVTSGGSSSSNVAGGEGDASAFASAGSNTDTFTISASESWATVGLELRSATPTILVDDILRPIRFSVTPYAFG